MTATQRHMRGIAIGCLFALSVSCFAQVPDEAVTVSFCYWGSFKENELWRQICEDFERNHPNVTIKRLWYVGEYMRKIQLDLINHKAADIILMDDELLPGFIVRGYVQDLAPYIERGSDPMERALAAEWAHTNAAPSARDPDFEPQLLPTSLESFNYRGFQGGLPWDGNATLIFYNKDLFDQENIPYPDNDWTWDDFRRIARELTRDLDNDGYPDQFGNNFLFSFLDFENVLWSFGGDVLNPERTRSLLNSPRALEAARFIHAMRYEDRSVAWTGEMQGMLSEVQLLTGRVGMVLSSSYLIGALNQVQDAMRWGIVHLPKGPGGDRYSRVTWDGISLNAHISPEKKEVGWAFIKHLLSDEAQERVAKTQRGFPVWKHMEGAYVNPQTPVREETAVEATQHGRLTPITPRYQEIKLTADNVFFGLNTAEVTGITPEEALRELDIRVNAVLRKEMDDWSKQLARAGGPHKGGAYSGLWTFAAVLGVLIVLVTGLGFFVRPMRRRMAYRLHEGRHMLASRLLRREAFEGVLFASPWLTGLILLQAFPIIFSIALSFCEWDPYEPISEMRFVGVANYARAASTDPITGDPDVLKALYNTFYYAFFAVPLSLMTSLGLALLLNQKVRGITIFRTTFYLPSIVAGVATVILWTYIFNPIFGPINNFIRIINNTFGVGLPMPMWLGDPHWSKPALIIMTLWAAGGAAMLIFLAGLQGVPDQLYEVAELDGAGRWRKFWNVTIPMLTPTIYFNLIMGIIASLKVFMQAFIMTNGTGGVDNSLLFFVLHLYVKGFIEFEMGYASALAWILFVIILLFTLLVIRSSAVWVYYEGEKQGR